MYDLIIIGAGPAGLTASIYASCYHLKHLIIGREIGGQLLLAPHILNYPGFEGISGKELTQRMVDQVNKRGGEMIIGSVVKINRINAAMENVTLRESSGQAMQQLSNNSSFEIETKEGNKYQTQAIILATGTERRKLNIPGEVEYTAKGVHYCATCEKFDYEGKICGVVGGANSAVQSAVELAQAAAKVYIIYRGSQLRGDPIWLEQVEKNTKIEVIYNTNVTEIIGDGQKVTGVKMQQLNNPPAGLSADKAGEAGATMQQLTLDKLFIEIGGVPGTALVIPLGVVMDPGGYIKVNEKLATSVPGIFAAGDLVSYGLSIEQISSAVGLGARAAASSFAYIKQEKAPSVWGESQIKR